jgi:hypothetical protein
MNKRKQTAARGSNKTEINLKKRPITAKLITEFLAGLSALL